MNVTATTITAGRAGLHTLMSRPTYLECAGCGQCWDDGDENASLAYPCPAASMPSAPALADTIEAALAGPIDITHGIGTRSFTATGDGAGARVDLHVRAGDAVLAGNGWSVTFPGFTPAAVVLAAFRAAALAVGVTA